LKFFQIAFANTNIFCKATNSQVIASVNG